MMSDNKDNKIYEVSSASSGEGVAEHIELNPKKVKFKWRVVDTFSPPEIYNWTLFFTVFIFGVLGAARGFDEGCVAGLIYQTSFKKTFGLSDPNKSKEEIANLKSNITSMVQLGSIGGALLASYTVDRLGRVLALQEVCVIWVIGAAIQISSTSVGQLYAGRFIEGLAVGQTTTIGPTFMSEVSPPAYRGLFNCMFAGAVYFGVFISYGANYGSATHMSPLSNSQWIVPTSIKIVLAGLVFIGSFFCYESPRWLMKVGKNEKALKNLSKLRHLPEDHPYIISEIADVEEQILLEREANDNYPIWKKFRDLVTVKSIRYRFFAIGCMAQVLGQWSGANAVTIYSSQLFGLVGYKGVNVLKMMTFFGFVKFFSAYFSAFFLIDFLGRRRALYCGIVVQGISILIFAIFLNIVPQAEIVGTVLTKSQFAAAQLATAALFMSGVGWTMGFNSVQYLLGSEIFPLGMRSFAQSIIMVLHFTNQYGNSKAMPLMMIALKPYGSFYLFTVVCLLSICWVWFFIPEISGRSLESMEEIFNLPWYLIGRRGAELCLDRSEVNRIAHTAPGGLFEEQKATLEQVEHVSENASVV